LLIFQTAEILDSGVFYLFTKSVFHLVKAVVNGTLELLKGFVIAIVKTLLFGEFPQAFDQI
jgi:hypothetical protein